MWKALHNYNREFICLGEVVLYTWVEWLKEQQHLWAPLKPEQAPPKRPDSDAELADAFQQVRSCSNLHLQSGLASILGSSVKLHVTILALHITSS